jgi:predicted ATPase/DNA-binding winged helix-turn-helix (wHTH) protein
MEPASSIDFGEYRLEPNVPRLTRGNHPVALQPRPLAVLCYLAARPGVVVSRDELIRTLWAGTHVTRAVLKVAVRAVREALGDSADSPRYVETVGQGYRFIGTGVEAAALEVPAMVGRIDDLALLRRAFVDAVADGWRVVFVTGEPGIGKTTLIDAFADDLARTRSALIARGRCLEQYGEGEAYRPALEAAGRLIREDASGMLAAIVRRHAPTWAALLPALGDAPPGAATATTPARVLREATDALEVVTQEAPLVLVLEDLQWSDPSTLDLIRAIAARREARGLLVVASFRPADVSPEHPLRVLQQELLADERCATLALAPLSLDDVAAYLERRFALGATREARSLAARIHGRTNGNALFMVNVANDLVLGGFLVRRDERWQVEGAIERATDGIPAGLRDLLAQRLRRLEPEAHHTLEVASVAGDRFVVASVAAALETDAERVEDVCETLASNGQLVTEAGVAEWPDGTISGRYRFLHALYRQALYEGVGASRRVHLHRAIGLREEAGFGARAGEHAAQLAMHFTRGRDHARAIDYHERAAAAARDRHAAHEAVGHLGAALDALAETPAGAGRAARELGLVVTQATLLMAIRGYAAPETERAFARARTLCATLPASPALFPVLRGLLSYHHVRARLDAAHELGRALLAHADRHPDDRALRVQAHYGHGATLVHMGRLASAREYLQAALREYDPTMHALHASVYGGYDPFVACSLWLAWALAFMGHLDESAARERAALVRARALDDSFTVAWACHAAAVTQLMFGNAAGSEALSAEAAALAEAHGFPHVLGMATANQGWAAIAQGKIESGVPMLRRGVAAVEATGAALLRPQYLGMLAAADAIEGNATGAVRRIDEALAEAERSGERLHEAGLLIEKGRLASALADECLRRALDVARRQGARLLELRAATALAGRGRSDEARALLAASLAPFADARTLAPEVVAGREILAGRER